MAKAPEDLDITTKRDKEMRKKKMMNKKHYIKSLVMLATMLLVACGSDGIEDTPPTTSSEAPKEIRVNTNLAKMQTRATIIDDNSDLQGYDLKIDAYYNGTDDKYLDGTKLHYTGGDPAWQFWSGSPGSQTHYYWPFEGSKTAGGATASTLDFVGFCPFIKPAYIGDPSYSHSTGVSFSCDMSSYMTLATQAGMQEFLIAVLNEQTLATQTAAGGALPLQFKHPLAIIKFTITAASGTNVQINSISIAGLNTNATCTYNGSMMNWSGYIGSEPITIAQTLKNGGTTETTAFMVIPKNYGTKTLTVNGTWTNWSNLTKDITTNININWEPGYIYTYALTVTPDALIVDSNKFTEQM